VTGDGHRQRIAELEAALAEKHRDYQRLENQVAAYVKQAEVYEAELRRNEEEKVRLLDHFRRVAEGNAGSALALEELDSPPDVHSVAPPSPTLRDVLSERITTVQTLRASLIDHQKMIRNLQEDNRLLKNALSTDFTRTPSGTFDRQSTASQGSSLRGRMS
jgi:septal ring factor EnvC (AmiA/AmiB activator)